MITVPPVSQAIMAVNQPVPCMSGGPMSVRKRIGVDSTYSANAAMSAGAGPRPPPAKR